MKGFEEFKNDLGQRESSNNYRCVNSLGFLGRYQFGKPRLWDLGLSIDGWRPKNFIEIPNYIRQLTRDQFLNDSVLQDKIFRDHVKNLSIRITVRYAAESARFTLSGLVAGAHLKGLGGVKSFIEGKDNEDAYGTKISEYIEKFKGYDLTEFLRNK